MTLTPVSSSKTEPVTGQPAKGSIPPCPPPQKPPASTGQLPIATAPTTKIEPLTGQPAKGSIPPCPPPQKPPASTGQLPIATAPTTKIEPLTGQQAKASEAPCPPPQKPPASTGQQAPNLPQDQTKASSSEKNPCGNPKQVNEPVGNSSNLPPSPPNRNLEGTTGKDSLEAKAGIDRLTGLSGADTFLFSGKPNSSQEKAIHITDFSAEEGDQIIINRNALGSFDKATNNLTTVNSTANLSTAFSTSDLFIYDSRSGVLYVNQNGAEAGFGSGGIFAVLDNHGILSSANISIV